MGIFSSFFNKNKSKDTAKRRLQFVLMHDRSDIAPEVMQALQKDILAVITKYMDVDDVGTEIRVSHDDNVAALEVSVPVKGMKRGSVISNISPTRAHISKNYK